MSDADERDAVVDNTVLSRYELTIDGRVACFADYAFDGGTTIFAHTFTEPAFRGRGLAAVVVRRALDDARAAHKHVAAPCWYVAEFISQHPEYADLRA